MFASDLRRESNINGVMIVTRKLVGAVTHTISLTPSWPRGVCAVLSTSGLAEVPKVTRSWPQVAQLLEAEGEFEPCKESSQRGS